MPGLGSSGEAFLSLIKSLQKGKGKERVSTNEVSQPRPFNEASKSSRRPPTAPSEVAEEPSWSDNHPATLGALEEWADPPPNMHQPQNEDEVFSGIFDEVKQPQRYTMIGRNFAPGTTADDIQVAVFPAGGQMESCHIRPHDPIVTAEMVFSEKARAVNVIAKFHNKKTDGYQLSLYMKTRDNLPQSEVSSFASVGPDKGKKASPAIPVLEGQEKNLYSPTNGPSPTQPLIEPWTPIVATEASDIHEGRGGAEEQDWKARVEFEESVFLEAEIERNEREAAEIRRQDKQAEIEELARLDAEILRVEREAEELLWRQRKAQKEEAARFTQQHPDSPSTHSNHKPELTTASGTGINNNTTTGTSAPIQLPSTSHRAPPRPVMPATSPRRAPASTPSTPLFSSGHDFLQALTKSSHLPAPVYTANFEPEQLSLPEDILPDELPTATKTLPDISNGQTRPASPLTQITTLGTLHTPSGEHTIHFPITQSNSTLQGKSMTLATSKPHSDSTSYSSTRHHTYPTSSKPHQQPPSSALHHHLPPHPQPHLNSSLPSNLPTTRNNKTLTLLSGSSPKGHKAHQRRYHRKELIEIGKKYRQKIFLGLLERNGKGRIIFGVTEGLQKTEIQQR
ncbi:MAG: hypothetical protein Q9200_002540 [Gallowayella weberi]